MTTRPAGGQDKAILDELAARSKAGEPRATLELWEAVRRFVELKARDHARVPGCRAQAGDFIQAGFLAVLDTAARYEPVEGKNFLHALAFSLRKAFATEEGTRSTRRDALQYADSTGARPLPASGPPGNAAAAEPPAGAAGLPGSVQRFLGVPGRGGPGNLEIYGPEPDRGGGPGEDGEWVKL